MKKIDTTKYFAVRETKQKTSDIITEMKKLFNVWCYYNDEILDKDFPAPKKLTTRYFKKNIEADEELKNKSANDLEKEEIEGITLRERLLLEIQYFKETGNHLDIDNITLCSGSRDSGGGVPRVGWRSGDRRVRVDWCLPSFSAAHIRARAVVSNPCTSSLVPSDLESRVESLEKDMENIRKFLII